MNSEELDKVATEMAKLAPPKTACVIILAAPHGEQFQMFRLSNVPELIMVEMLQKTIAEVTKGMPLN